MKKRSLATRSWEVISVSKYEAFRLCEFQFACQYVDRIEVPKSHWTILGEDLHKMFDYFFTKNFQSKDSFLGYWKGLWFRRVKKDSILWRGQANAGSAWQRGQEILSLFWDYNLNYRLGANDCLPPITTEKKHRFELAGFKLEVRLDRVQRWLVDGQEQIGLIDYKTGRSPINPDEQALNIMWTIYQLAFRDLIGRMPDRLEIHAFPVRFDQNKQPSVSYEVVSVPTRIYFDDLVAMLTNFRVVNESIASRRHPISSGQQPRLDLDLYGSGDLRLVDYPKRTGAHCRRFCDWYWHCDPFGDVSRQADPAEPAVRDRTLDPTWARALDRSLDKLPPTDPPTSGRLPLPKRVHNKVKFRPVEN